MKKISRKEYHKKYEAEHREEINAQRREYRSERYEEEGQWRDQGPKAAKNKAWMIKLKSRPCKDCGHKFPMCCMDFDHRPGTKKKYCIGTMFAHHYSRELIRNELRKCDLERLVRTVKMARACEACTEGNPADPNGPLMGELDCMVELMMMTELSADELAKTYGPKLWRMIK
jgi:hypothetical protein